MTLDAAAAAALIPPAFAELVRPRPPEEGPSGADWLEALPGRIAELLEEWRLEPSGAPRHGACALVLPVAGPQLSAGAVLKLGWPHAESAVEHLALRRWGGDGAVRLLRADPARGALLLERLADEDLAELWDEDACEVVAGLCRRLHVAPIPQAPRLSAWARRQDAGLEALQGRRDGPRLPPRMVAHARALIRELAADPGCDAVLLHGDLHYGNVLRRGSDWVAIDPKPMAGHPAFEVLPMLVNRVAEMGDGAGFRYLLRRRLEVLCDAAGIEPELARDWSIVRETVNALWAAEEGRAGEARIGLAGHQGARGLIRRRAAGCPLGSARRHVKSASAALEPP